MRNILRFKVPILLFVSLFITICLYKPFSSQRNLALPSSQSTNNQPLIAPDAVTEARIKEHYGKLPLSFESNKGQTDQSVDFISRGNGYNLFLKANQAVLTLRSGNKVTAQHATKFNIKDQVATEKRAVLKMALVGANDKAKVAGVDQLTGKSNYFIGNDQNQWRTDVSNYARVQYQDVYPGIDMVYYGNQRQLEYDFIVQPGIDPHQIKLHFDGAESLKLDSNGDLIIKAGGGEVRKQKPVIYQENNGNRQIIDGNYIINEHNEIAFQTAQYDVNKPLIIDPVLSYATYLGGNQGDSGSGIAVDSSGNVYITGVTNSLDFPTASAFQTPLTALNPKSNTFITKMNSAGNALIYSTYLIGDGFSQATAIAVDAQGNAYITGYTQARQFPISELPNTLPTDRGKVDVDAFVAKINSAGNALVYSKLIAGSSGDDLGRGIAVDSLGNAYVIGDTNSKTFPTVNALQATKPGFDFDAFVTKISSEGTVIYATFLGGSDDDYGRAVAVDSLDNIYVTGYTRSSDFPSVNALQPINSSIDAFVAKINSEGSALIYATYLGGSSTDFGLAIAVDSFNNAYITGYTDSQDFPTANALQKAVNGFNSTDIFVTKVNADGNALVYSTYLGGSNNDYGQAIAIDARGNVYVTGTTTSKDFPVVNATQLTNSGGDQFGYDAFITKINSSGRALIYATYLGGTKDDQGNSVAIDAFGSVYVAGITASTDFPVVNALQPASANSSDTFVAKIDLSSIIIKPTINEVLPNTAAIGATIVINGSGFTGASKVKFNTTKATNFSVVSDTQIMVIVPDGATRGKVKVITPAGKAVSADKFMVVTR